MKETTFNANPTVNRFSETQKNWTKICYEFVLGKAAFKTPEVTQE